MEIRRERVTGKGLREGLIVLAALLVTGLFFAVLQYQGVPVCFLRRHTGYPCLFCGSSRAAFFLLQGNLGAAFAPQPLISLLLIISTLAGSIFFVTFIIKREVIVVSLSEREKWIFSLVTLFLFLLNWIYLFLS